MTRSTPSRWKRIKARIRWADRIAVETACNWLDDLATRIERWADR